MKKISNIILLSIVLIASACDDGRYEMLTVIKKDGSCSREFTGKADSLFMVGDITNSNPFPFFIDSTWDISWTYDSLTKSTNWPLEIWEPENKKKEVIVYAKRNFPTIDSMASFDYLTRGNWQYITPYITFKKKFRWFYTYYFFTETFPKIEPFNKVSITEYISEEEAKMWLQDNEYCFEGMNGIEIAEHLTHIEKEFDNWIDRNIYEEYIDVIINNIDLLDSPMIDRQRILLAKDSIYNSYRKKGKDVWEFDIKVLDDYFHTDAFTKMINKHDKIEQEFDSTMLFINYFHNQLDYHLVMPGRVISTSSSVRNSDTLYWKVDAYRFSLYDYEIYAESRTSNLWAFILSAVIIVIAIWVFFIPTNKNIFFDNKHH